MKIILVLLLSCVTLLSETKAEADLRKQLAAAKQEISARDAHIKLLQAGQKKLADAVVETSQENSKKIDAATDRIIKSEADGKKLVETVKSQAAATQNATAQLADEVKINNVAVKSVISAQAKQQERALAAAREVARKLEKSNAELAKAKQEDAARMEEMKKSLEDIKIHDDLMAAKDDAAMRHDRYQLMRDIVTPICGVLSLIVVLFQIRARRDAKDQKESLGKIEKTQDLTHGIVDGRYTALEDRTKSQEAEIETLRAQLAARNP